MDIRPTSVVVSVPATKLPVTLDEVKNHLRITDNGEDGLLLNMLRTVVDEFERDTQRHLISATVIEYYETLPLESCDYWELHRAPVSAITSVSYKDQNGATQTWASTNYQTDLNAAPPYLTLTSTASLPSVSTTLLNPVWITYTAGYGAAATAVPYIAKDAIMRRCVSRFEERGFDTESDRYWQKAVRHLIYAR